MGSRRETAMRTKVISFSSSIESTDYMEVALVSKMLNKIKKAKFTLEQAMKGRG